MRLLLIAVAATLLLASPAAAAPTWLPPVNLTGESPDQSTSAIAVAPDGTTVAVWSRTVPGGSVVEAARRAPGQSFAAPVALTTAAEMGTTPVVGIDDQANATVAWAQAGGVVRAARLPAGAGAFEPADTVSGASTQANRPAIGVGPGGTAVVAFEAEFGGQREQRAAVRSGPGGSFAPATTISGPFNAFQAPPFGAASATDVAVNAAGDAAVTWAGQVEAIPNQRFEVQATFRPAGGSFPPTGQTPTPTVNPQTETDPSIALAPDGRATLAWTFDPSFINGVIPEIVQFSDRPPGGPDYSAGATASVPGERAAQPNLAATGNGTVLGVWSSGSGTNIKVQAAVRPPGGAFQEHTPLSAPGMSFVLPQVAVNAAGVGMFVWGGSMAEAIFAVRRTPDGQYGGVLEVANTPALPPGEDFNFFNPRVALDDEGNAGAVWLFNHFRGGTNNFRIQSAAFDAAPPTLTASVPPGGSQGAPIGMAAAATDRLSAISINWAFGDGGTAAGGAVQHAFGAAGAFTVTVTATDAVGNATTTTRPVLVTAVPPPPKKRITSKVQITWGLQGKKIFLIRLVVPRVPKGAKAQLRCTGKKCPLKRKTFKRNRKGTIVLFKEIKAVKAAGTKRRNFRGGQRVELRITAPGFIGKVTRYKLKTGRIPTAQNLCLPVGAKKPRKKCT